MKFIKRLFYNVKSSIYDPKFYRQPKTWWSAFTFILILIIIEAVFFIAILGKNVVPFVKDISRGYFVEDFYPEGLVVDIKNGEVSANVPLPYIIPEKGETSPYTNLFVIDTRKDISLSAIDSYNSAVVLTSNSLVVKKESGEVRIVSLKDVKSFTLSEENVKKWVQKGAEIFWMLSVPLALIIMIFYIFFEFSFFLVFLLIGALAAILIARLFRFRISYKDAYILSMFALGPIIILNILGVIFGISNPLWLTSVLFLIILLVNLSPSSQSEEIIHTEQTVVEKPDKE